MDAKAEPKHKRKKIQMNPAPSFSSLPDDILLNCLARTSRSDYRPVSLVSKSIRSLLSCPELYRSRSRIGNTEPCLYVRQKLPNCDRWYALDRTLITNGWIKDETSLSPISCSALSKSTTVAVGFEIYQMGGTKWPSSAVRVLDCRHHTWHDAPNMTVARKRPESCFIDGKIYVIGGTEEESIKSWAEVFDLKTQTWKPFPSPIIHAKVQLHNGGVLFIRNGHTNYAYDSKDGRWKQEYWGFGLVSKDEPWCVIGNVKFTFFLRCVPKRKVMWYDSESRNWLMVEGLEDLNMKPGTSYSTLQLANYRGKLIILWHETLPLIEFPVIGKQRKYRCKNKRIWCAVIRLENRMGKIWGEIERSNPVLTVPNSYHVLTCITL